MKKAIREKMVASTRNVSCHCVKYQEGGKTVGWMEGGNGCQRKKLREEGKLSEKTLIERKEKS